VLGSGTRDRLTSDPQTTRCAPLIGAS
jgi:hypothetical protein